MDICTKLLHHVVRNAVAELVEIVFSDVARDDLVPGQRCVTTTRPAAYLTGAL